MTNFKSHNQLLTLEYDFSSRKISQIDAYINNLKLDKLQNEEDLISTLEIIKDKFIPVPVKFGELKIVNHREIQKKFNAGSYASPFGGNRTVYIVTVAVEFTGSPELFQFKPSSYSIGGYPNVFQPTSNTINIEVEVFTLDKDVVLTDAMNKIRMTSEFIEHNNSYIQSWQADAILYIEKKLREQKSILGNLYS